MPWYAQLRTALSTTSATASASWRSKLYSGIWQFGAEGRRLTTVLCVRKDDEVVIVGDGQITQGNSIVKPNTKKVRTIGETAVGGFAGTTADALTLFQELENNISKYPEQLKRSAVELAKSWRTERLYRQLEATMLVADKETTLIISGNGDVIEPHDGVMAIGSGAPYALAAARALIDIQEMDARSIASKAMKIAADADAMTNHTFSSLIIRDQKIEECEI